MPHPLWFTSATSFDMNGSGVTSFAGIYSCTLDESTGICDDNQVVTNSKMKEDGHQKSGIDLSNVQINHSKNRLYAAHLTGNPYFEVLHTPLEVENSNRVLDTYFRMEKMYNALPNSGLQDCNPNGSRYQYKDLLPVSFLFDADENMYISWEGFFQDCDDPDESLNGLVWTIGVSLVDSSCIMQDKVAAFDRCTTPKVIFYKGFYGKDRRLGSGFAMTTSPANRNLFYVTVQDRSSSNPGNKIWVMPEGFAKRPVALAGDEGDIPGVSGLITNRIIRDVSTLRMSLDEYGYPRTVCRTVYDQGVYCHKVALNDDGDKLDFYVTGEKPILSLGPEKIAESCTLPESNYYRLEKEMSPMSTGLEVLWNDNGDPDLLVFGCWGQLAGKGNMTTVFPNGDTIQTMSGAFPGSVIFGIELQEINQDNLEETYAKVLQNDESSSMSVAVPLSIFFVVVLLFNFLAIRSQRKTETEDSNEQNPSDGEDRKDDTLGAVEAGIDVDDSEVSVSEEFMDEGSSAVYSSASESVSEQQFESQNFSEGELESESNDDSFVEEAIDDASEPSRFSNRSLV